MDMPEDIYVTLWAAVRERIKAGVFCWNAEIAKELESIDGQTGQCIKDCTDAMCFEIGVGDWDWQAYIAHVERCRVQYRQYISEYNGNRKRTVGLNDVSIVCLAKTLGLPILNMEAPNRHQGSDSRMRIPDLCIAEGVEPYDFVRFLRSEGIRL